MADLAVLPVGVYEALAAIGGPRQQPAARGTRPRPVAASQGLSRPPASPIVGRELAGLLNDTSDGRDSRILSVVRLLRDRPDEEVKRTVTAGPPGEQGQRAEQPGRLPAGQDRLVAGADGHRCPGLGPGRLLGGRPPRGSVFG